jgi:ABC-2 type transport system ATP-binding protein
MQEMQKATQAIAVEHLVKRYPRSQHNAVDDISFSVRHGETFGLLGPNGAGKTTTIGILTTSVLPSSGRGIKLFHRRVVS